MPKQIINPIQLSKAIMKVNSMVRNYIEGKKKRKKK